MKYFTLIVKAIVMLPVTLFFKMFPGIALKTSISMQQDRLAEAAKAVAMERSRVEKLRRLVDDTQRETLKLESAVKKCMEEKNEGKAREFAQTLIAAKTRLEKYQKELAQAEASYESNVKLVKKGAELVQDAKEDVKSMEIQLEVAKAKKSTAELSASLKDNIGGFGILAEAKENMQSQIDQYEGEASLMNDMSGTNDSLDDYSASAEVDDLLAAYRTKEPETHLEQVLVETEARKEGAV